MSNRSRHGDRFVRNPSARRRQSGLHEQRAAIVSLGSYPGQQIVAVRDVNTLLQGDVVESLVHATQPK